MYNNKNIVLHELIGLHAEVIWSKEKSQKGIKGTVVDETKNTLTILTKDGEKIIPKKISRFKFIADKNRFIVDGKEIAFRPYERLEKGLKYYKKRGY
jgi:ribonuclease P protein subunit POP4